MKTSRILATSALALIVLAGGICAADAIKSGPQVGDTVPGPFEPLNINGAHAGEKFCQYCINGNNPVAMVFARDVSEPVTKLIKEIDAATVKNADAKMGSFFVFLSDDEATQNKLKELAKTEGIKKTVLTLDNQNGPAKYDIAKDADVTVVLYTGRVVKANYSFKKGEMKDADIEKVIGDLPKIVK
jgi:hypothetical protein